MIEITGKLEFAHIPVMTELIQYVTPTWIGLY